MNVVSVHVGLPREVEWHGRLVRTSIWKSAVDAQVRVGRLNLEGDQQSDLSVHGGRDKAVYLYPSEHYAFWKDQLPGVELPWGAFGENLTTEGLLESEVRIGDCLRIGSAECIVTQPRMPCFNLGIRLGRDDIVQRFLESGRSGFYVAVLEEGHVSRGDRIDVTKWNESSVSVREMSRLYFSDSADQALLRRAIELQALPEGWKQRFRKRLRG